MIKEKVLRSITGLSELDYELLNKRFNFLDVDRTIITCSLKEDNDRQATLGISTLMSMAISQIIIQEIPDNPDNATKLYEEVRTLYNDLSHIIESTTDANKINEARYIVLSETVPPMIRCLFDVDVSIVDRNVTRADLLEVYKENNDLPELPSLQDILDGNIEKECSCDCCTCDKSDKQEVKAESKSININEDDVSQIINDLAEVSRKIGAIGEQLFKLINK